MRWLTNFHDFSFKWTATAAIRIHPTKAWLSQLVNLKMQSGREEERYAIKICFTLGKNATEMYGMLQTAFRPSCRNRASVYVWHKRFKEARESVRDGGRGVRKSIHHSWLAKGLGLGLLYWGFMGVQEEIPREEASTLQIGSVAFPPGQYISPQLHLCHRLFDQVPQSPYSQDVDPCDFSLFRKLRGCRYETTEEMKEAVTKVIGTLTQENFHETFEKLLERYRKCIEAGGDYFEGD